jgi:hypothetical protein
MRCSAALAGAISIVVVVGACSDDIDAPTGPNVSVALNSAKAIERPLTGSCQTAYEIDFEFLPPPLQDVPVRATTHHVGTCLLSHLGTASLVLDEVIDFTETGALAEGTLTLTAANGDRLSGTETAEVVAPDSEGAITFEGTWRFYGGTGRFQAAEGNASFVGSGDVIGTTTQRKLEGSLTY